MGRDHGRNQGFEDFSWYMAMTPSYGKSFGRFCTIFTRKGDKLMVIPCEFGAGCDCKREKDKMKSVITEKGTRGHILEDHLGPKIQLNSCLNSCENPLLKSVKWTIDFHVSILL